MRKSFNCFKAVMLAIIFILSAQVAITAQSARGSIKIDGIWQKIQESDNPNGPFHKDYDRVMRLKSDGTAEIKRNNLERLMTPKEYFSDDNILYEINYTVNGNKLTIGPDVCTFKLNDNILTLTYPDGRTFRFKKIR